MVCIVRIYTGLQIAVFVNSVGENIKLFVGDI